MVKRVLGAAFALLLLAGTAPAQEGAVLRGVVTDSATGAPIQGARVAAGDARLASTDGDGRFTLCRLPDGPSVVKVRQAFYSEREESVELATGDTVQVAVALRRSGVIRLRPTSDVPPEALLIVDGVHIFHSWSGCEAAPPGMPTSKDLDPDEVESVVVLKGNVAVAHYGPDAKHGALVITTTRKAVRPSP